MKNKLLFLCCVLQWCICSSQGLQYRLAQVNSEDEVIKREKFTVSLKPAILQIVLSKTKGLVRFEIVNTLNEPIFENQIAGQSWEINLKSLNMQSGIYFTEISALDGSNTFKNRLVYVSE